MSFVFWYDSIITFKAHSLQQVEGVPDEGLFPTGSRGLGVL